MDPVSIEPLDQPSTHASRHPEKPIIPPRHNYEKKSRAEAETAAVGRALKQEKKRALEEDIKEFLEQKEQCAVDLATKHNVDVVKMRTMLNAASTVRHSRRVNSWNALVQRRSQELNEGRAKYDRVKLKEVQAIVRREIEDGDYDEEDIEESREALEESREVKLKGARSSNRAAAVDYNATTRRIATELANLHERCGTMGFAFVTRGHVHDTIVPEWIESQGSLAFLNEVLLITPAELLRKFEQWACAQDRTKQTYSIDDLRSESVNIIISGLKKILGTANVSMSYENYETHIVQQHGVHLRGWPAGLKRQSPSKITNMEDARSLHSALTSGECLWVKLTRQEKEARARKVQEKVANGEIAPKTRKKRSDAGKKRGPRASKVGEKRKQIDGERGEVSDTDSEKENAPQKKRKKKGRGVLDQLPPMPKSKAIISDTDDDDD
ncbi:hypothetical protein H0H92_008452 [Tricholoma furcatifolium]|nr:hypothetical protein H0H92_008452 [Tricholoma furcatifolium]